MNKKTLTILLAAPLFAASSAAVANTKFTFDGFYTGGGIGGSFTSGRLREFSNASFIAASAFTSSVTHNVNAGLRGDPFTGAIFAGYGFSCWDPIYLSAEAYFKAANNKTSYSDTTSFVTSSGGADFTGSFTHRKTAKLWNGEFGLDLRPGLLITCNTLLYGRVGIAFNRVSLSSSGAFSGTVSTFAGGRPIGAPFSSKQRKGGVGLRLGLGLEQEICPCFTIRADYVFTQYRKVHLNQTAAANTSIVIPPPPPDPDAPTAPPGPGTVQTATGILREATNAKLYNNTVLLSLSYYW